MGNCDTYQSHNLYIRFPVQLLFCESLWLGTDKKGWLLEVWLLQMPKENKN